MKTRVCLLVVLLADSVLADPPTSQPAVGLVKVCYFTDPPKQEVLSSAEPAVCRAVMNWLRKAENGPVSEHARQGACRYDAKLEIYTGAADAKPSRTIMLFTSCNHVAGRVVTAEQFRELPTLLTTSAPTSQPAKDEKAVAEQIKRLGDRNYGVREAATQKLIEMGQAAHPVLKAKLLERALDPEVATRIQAVLDKTTPAKEGKDVTDRASGITVTIQPDGKIAAFQNGKMLWTTQMGGAAPTGLKIENGTVIVLPNNVGIDLGTGKLLWAKRPGP